MFNTFNYQRLYEARDWKQEHSLRMIDITESVIDSNLVLKELESKYREKLDKRAALLQKYQIIFVVSFAGLGLLLGEV